MAGIGICAGVSVSLLIVYADADNTTVRILSASIAVFLVIIIGVLIPTLLKTYRNEQTYGETPGVIRPDRGQGRLGRVSRFIGWLRF